MQVLTGRQKAKALILVLAVVSCLLPCRADDTAAVHYQSGLAYERLGRLNESYTELQLASNLDPANSTIAVALGVLAIRLARFDEARRAFEHAIVLNANSVASYYELALIYEKAGLPDRAIESWHRFMALNQDAEMKGFAERHVQYLESQNRL